MEMTVIFDMWALTKVQNKLYNFKTGSLNALKTCTQIEDIQMKKPTRVFLVLMNITFLISFCVKTKKIDNI